MERLNFKLAASAVMIICVVNGAQAGGGQQAVNAQANSTSRFDDFDRWKQVVVLSAYVNADEETATLRSPLRETDADRLLRNREDERVALERH